MYVPCIWYNSLFRPTNALSINNNVIKLKYSDMFRCIYIIFKDSLLMFRKVTKSIKLITLKYIKVKINLTLEQATKTHRGSRVVTLLFL